MLHVARAIVEVLADFLKLAALFLRPASEIRAENLALRKQLAAYIERGVRPRRLHHAGRVSLSVLSRLFGWRDAIVIVRPSTVIRWHRLGWRIVWRWKSRAGRPPIPPELRSLIRRMAGENPLWGEERIANELLIKLGIRVSPRTVGKYMPERPLGQSSHVLTSAGRLFSRTMRRRFLPATSLSRLRRPFGSYTCLLLSSTGHVVLPSSM